MSAGTGIRHAYLVVAAGRIEADGEPMAAFDGVAITNAAAIDAGALEDSELPLVQTDDSP